MIDTSLRVAWLIMQKTYDTNNDKVINNKLYITIVIEK